MVDICLKSELQLDSIMLGKANTLKFPFYINIHIDDMITVYFTTLQFVCINAVNS